MKKHIGMVVAAGLCGSVYAQVVTTATITPTHIGNPGTTIGGLEGFNYDLFDGNFTVTDHSPLHPLSNSTSNWFVSPNVGDVGGLLVFADTNMPNFIEFNTAEPVTLGSMVFYLGGDHNTSGIEGRSLSNIVISAGSAPGAFTQVADIAVNPDYDATYGLPWIKVLVEFPNPVTAKYFRIDIEQPDIFAAKPTWDWNGPRIREIDAYGTNVTTSAASIIAKAVGVESIDGASNDDWEGATVTTNSALHPASSIPVDYWFLSPNPAGTELLFDDNAQIQTIEFNTPDAYSLSKFVVSISGDDVESGIEGRAISGIRLLGGLTPDTITNNVMAYVTFTGEYTGTYGSPWLEVTIDLDPATAIGQYFRIEFDQYSSGARIMEIDGYGEIFIEEILQPAILSWSPSAPGIMRMVVDAPSAAERYSLTGKPNLILAGWSDVPHSDDGVNAFIPTNLSYSTSEGTNEVIYVQSSDARKFFRIEGN